MPRKLAPIAATVALFAALAAFAPNAGATKPCPTDKFCTAPTGEYVLEVPPLSSSPFLAEFADCTWDVHVDFGDGTTQDYVFDGSIGLTGSHVFPTPGVLYTVLIKLRDGQATQGSVTCLNVDKKAEVLYRTAAEEADDPPKEEPGPWVPIENGSIVPAPIAVKPDAAIPSPLPPAAVTEPPAVSDTSPYWRICRARVRTHLVTCAKGRSVARAALEKLTRPGLASSSGFTCRLPRGNALAIACARGEQRVLVSLP